MTHRNTLPLSSGVKSKPSQQQAVKRLHYAFCWLAWCACLLKSRFQSISQGLLSVIVSQWRVICGKQWELSEFSVYSLKLYQNSVKFWLTLVTYISRPATFWTYSLPCSLNWDLTTGPANFVCKLGCELTAFKTKIEGNKWNTVDNDYNLTL
jgi:hypothetical protein